MVLKSSYVYCLFYLIYSMNLFASSSTVEPHIYLEDDKLIVDHQEIKNVVVDLNGIMFQTNKFKAIKKIGLPTVLSYVLMNGFPNTDGLFQLLQTIPAKNQGQQVIHQGSPLPPILVDWQLGLRSSTDILTIIHPLIEAQPLSASKKKLYHRLISFMLTPRDLVDSFDPIVQGHRLIKSLRLYQRHLRLIVLSNWDKESFPLLVESFPDFFNLLDGYVVSGLVGKVKPSPDIFQHLITQYEINPKNTLFIDDETANILTAQSLGFQTLEIEHLPDLISQLKRHGRWLNCL